MQKTIKLTRIFTTDKNKDGTPLKSAKGVPYTKMSVKSVEYGDKWISGFKNKENANWKDGDVVECIIEEKVTDKGTFLNFSLPKREDVATAEIGKVHNLLTSMNLVLLQIAEKVGVNIYSADGKYAEGTGKLKDTVEYPDDGIPDIQF